MRFGISGVLICLWAWHFVYMNLYPISSAYYEYTHDLTEEKVGVIECIEQKGKDRIKVIINRTEYTMVHSSANPLVIIGKDIDEGDNLIEKQTVSVSLLYEAILRKHFFNNTVELFFVHMILPCAILCVSLVLEGLLNQTSFLSKISC